MRRVLRDHGWLVVAAVMIAAVLGCGRVVPTPSPSPSSLPPPRVGASDCPPITAEPILLARLANGGIKVTAASASVAAALFPTAASVCLMDVGGDSFEVAYFADTARASALRVCESRSTSRYLYQVNGRTMDAAFPLYWSVSDALLIWTKSADLDASIRRALNGVRAPC
jgi:hypothetical protein